MQRCRNVHDKLVLASVSFPSDDTPPTFKRCQEDFVQETFPGLDAPLEGQVSWLDLRDEVEDNSGEKPTVSVDPQDAEDHSRKWTIGSHRVTYSAIDCAGNIGRCSFEVTVVGSSQK